MSIQNGYTELIRLQEEIRSELVRIIFDETRTAEDGIEAARELLRGGVRKKREIEARYASAGSPRQKEAVRCR